jgi:periplasmic divalent cation tolerance protein
MPEDAMTEMIVILSTAPDAAKSAEIGTILVEERLVACVNIVPEVRSVYWWEGTVHNDREALLLLKTRADLFEQVRARLVSLHPYECPEIVQLRVEAGHEPYLACLTASVRPKTG